MSVTLSRSKRAANNFEIISRDFLRDARLSFKARGLGAWLMSHAEGYVTSVGQIAAINYCGVDQVKTGLRELEHYGYLRRGQQRTDTGFGNGLYYIADQPVEFGDEPAGGKPDDRKPRDRDGGKPDGGKPAYQETHPPYKESIPKEYQEQGDQLSSREDDPAGSSGELDLGISAPPREPNAAPVVAAYVDSFEASSGARPLTRDLAKIGKETKRLLADGVPQAELVLAATALGMTKFTDLATAYRELKVRASRRSTTDDRVRQALALVRDPAELTSSIGLNPFDFAPTKEIE